MRSKLLFLTLSLVPAAWCATDLVPVVSKPVSRTIDLPGEFLPYLSVAIHARIGGYIETISVDRGSVVKQGQVLAELSAPEIKARIVEARSRVDAAEADRAQAEAQLAAAQSTLEHLKQAAATPGVIAGTEIIQAEKMVDAAKALVQSREQSRRAAQAGVDAEKELEAYLRITAPFDGVVTERFLHPGALAGPRVLEHIVDTVLYVESAALNAAAAFPPASRCVRSGDRYRRHHARGVRYVPCARLSRSRLLGHGGPSGAHGGKQVAHHGRRGGRHEP